MFYDFVHFCTKMYIGKIYWPINISFIIARINVTLDSRLKIIGKNDIATIFIIKPP